MIAQRIASLQEVAGAVREGEKLRDPLRDFLDGFYADPRPERLAEEPPLLAGALNDGGFADAYLAAVGDHLSRRHRLPRPAWVNGPARVLKHPYFAAKTHALRMIYLQESPSAFRERNIFVSANTLSRA